MRIADFLDKQSKTNVTLFVGILVAIVGYIDYITGVEMSFSIFYLIPVSLAAWFLGRRAGLMTSAFSSVIWLTADLVTNSTYSHPAIPYWNAAVGFGLFIIVTYALSTAHANLQVQEQLTQFIVHDLRSPLTNVITGLQTLQLIIDEPGEDKNELIAMAINGGNRMLTLINSMLDLSRLEGGRMPVQKEQVSVKEMVDKSLEQVALWASQNHVTLSSQIEPGIETLMADKELTTRVLVNLLSNALKFSPEESTITIRVSAKSPDLLLFGVSDQGPGISPEWARKVFDRFAQVESRKHGAAVGSGLGLAFCRLAVESQGGKIWLESELGKGTTFLFTLPV